MRQGQRFELSMLERTWGTALWSLPFLIYCFYNTVVLEPWLLKLLFGCLTLWQLWFMFSLFGLRENYVEVSETAVKVRDPFRRLEFGLEQIVGIERSPQSGSQKSGSAVNVAISPPSWGLIVVPLFWRYGHIRVALHPKDVDPFLALLRQRLQPFGASDTQ